jgi:hypothetical protein
MKDLLMMPPTTCVMHHRHDGLHFLFNAVAVQIAVS